MWTGEVRDDCQQTDSFELRVTYLSILRLEKLASLFQVRLVIKQDTF